MIQLSRVSHKSLRYETLSVVCWCLTELCIQLADRAKIYISASFFIAVGTFMFSNCFQSETTEAEVWQGCDEVQFSGGTNPRASAHIVRIWWSFLCNTKSTRGGLFLIFFLSRRGTSGVSIRGIYRIGPFIFALASSSSISPTSSS